MRLCCATKGCANVQEKPDHKKGFLIMFCPRCKRTTDHFPVPSVDGFLPRTGHTGRFNNTLQFKTRKT